jgi:hypothetical protein
MNLFPLFAIFDALEDFAGDVSASYFEFWGTLMEAFTPENLR